MAFELHRDHEARRRSAVILIKHLLSEKNPEILPAHRRELLKILLFKITEAECQHKHKTRFQSDQALCCGNSKNLRHDHVYQRVKMAAILENAAQEEIDGILKTAIGCTVTTEENVRLAKFDCEYGWERYRKAGIKAKNPETNEDLI